MFLFWRIVVLKKQIVLWIFWGTTALFTACGNAKVTDDVTAEQDATVAGTEVIVETAEEKTTEETDSSADSSTENAIATKPDKEAVYGEEFSYDTTYLVQDNGVYVYRLSDPELIKKYDELYAEAFADCIASYNEVMEWMDQDYEGEQPVATSNLLFQETDVKPVISTGSYFEMDYNFDLNNLGYTYVDLDSDGVFELIFGVCNKTYEGDDGYYLKFFERAYALLDGKPVKIVEAGSRAVHWLGYDGHIYENGSSGAAYGGVYRYHFDKTLLTHDDVDWGNMGFVIDEFWGLWEVPVHIVGPVTDFDQAALLPENQTDDWDFDSIYEEADRRRVHIDWLKMSDYLALYYPEGI